MVEMLCHISSYGFPGESKSRRKNRNSNIGCLYLCLHPGILCSIVQRSLRNSSCIDSSQVLPMIGRIARFGFHSCLAGEIEAELVVSDRIENGEFGVNGFVESKIFKVNKEIPEESYSAPFSDLQSTFKISQLKVHFLEERDEEILSKRILTLSRSNKVRSALELYLSMDVAGLRTTSHACNSLLACLVRKNSIDDALVLFDIMRKKGLPTGHSYSLVLKAVAGTKGFIQAMEMFSSFVDDESSNNVFDMVVYDTMISICGKSKNWLEAEKTWRKFKQNNLKGTMITYSLLISTFVQCGATELALDAYHEMISRGLEPDEDIMKAIVASCTKDGKWALSLSMLKKMLERGIKPSVIAYNSLINCLGKAGEDDLAFRVYKLMKISGMKPDDYTWSALLNALYRSKRYADALQLFENFRALLISQSHCQAYNIALMSCQRLGLWERSLQLLCQMETGGMKMSTLSYNHAIRACETARKPEIALQVYEHMIDQKQTPDTFTYLSLIRACIWGSLWTEVEKISECIPLDASLYNALVQGFCLRGKIFLAKQMYAKMRSNGLAPDGKTRAMMLQHLSDNASKRLYRSRSWRKTRPFMKYSPAKMPEKLHVDQFIE